VVLAKLLVLVLLACVGLLHRVPAAPQVSTLLCGLVFLCVAASTCACRRHLGLLELLGCGVLVVVVVVVVVVAAAAAAAAVGRLWVELVLGQDGGCSESVDVVTGGKGALELLPGVALKQVLAQADAAVLGHLAVLAVGNGDQGVEVHWRRHVGVKLVGW